MSWVGVGQTDVGRRRKNNEDAIVSNDELGLYAVSDGMGGQAAGEVASAQTVASITDVILTGIATVANRDDAIALVTAAVERANQDVYARAKNERDKAGMGCTLTMALVRDDFAIIGHVGDSRGYLVRAGDAAVLTMDHTVAEEMRRAHPQMADEVARGPFGASLSRYVGMQPEVRADVFAVDLVAGDKLLLCSDGLSRYIPSQQWLVDMLNGSALGAIAEELVEHALAAGGHDNISVVLVSGETLSKTRVRALSLVGMQQGLSATFLFQGLSRGLMLRVAGHTEIEQVEAGVVLQRQGSQVDRLFMVLAGTVDIMRGDKCIGQLGVGEHTGATTLLHPRAARSSLRASGPATVAIFRRRSFWRLCKARPRLGVNLMERLVRRLSRELDDSIVRRDDGDANTSVLFPYQKL